MLTVVPAGVVIVTVGDCVGIGACLGKQVGAAVGWQVIKRVDCSDGSTVISLCGIKPAYYPYPECKHMVYPVLGIIVLINFVIC
jgi:hypothetical protein